MNKLEIKIQKLEDEIFRNKMDFNSTRKGRKDVVAFQDEYFKKQDTLRAEIEKCERQNLLYKDLKELGILKEY